MPSSRTSTRPKTGTGGSGSGGSGGRARAAAQGRPARRGARGRNVSLEQRMVAARLLLDARAAGRAPSYVQHPLLAGVASPGRIAKRFAGRLAANQSVQDAPRSGRPRKFTDAEARAAARIVLAGVKLADGRTAKFTSLQDAIRRSPKLAQLCQQRHADPATLCNAMRRAEPELKLRRAFAKRPVSARWRAWRKRHPRAWMTAAVARGAG